MTATPSTFWRAAGLSYLRVCLFFDPIYVDHSSHLIYILNGDNHVVSVSVIVACCNLYLHAEECAQGACKDSCTCKRRCQLHPVHFPGDNKMCDDGMCSSTFAAAADVNPLHASLLIEGWEAGK